MRQNKKKNWISHLPATAMIGLVIAAIATPSAAAVDLLPDDRAGAIAIVLGVSVLVVALVVEVWRQTAKHSLSALEQDIADRKARNRRTGTHA